MDTKMTAQAQRSAAHFNLSENDLHYVLDNGCYLEYKDHYDVLLRACDISLEEYKRNRFARLIGVTLILNPTCQIISDVVRTRNHKSRREPYQRHGRRQNLSLAA